MPPSWNEINSSALSFSRTWADTAVDKACKACDGKTTYTNEAERVAFLFEQYQRQIILLAVGTVDKGKRQPLIHLEE
jgi:hypothetical protein